MRFSLYVVLALCLAWTLGIAAPVTPPVWETPRLQWESRSDWMNVKAHGAKGDGVADDTAAIQAVYNLLGKDGQPCVAYFPPGTYRITNTLTIVGDISGLALIGCGRDTVLVWDGPAGGSMYWSNGVHRTRYVGLTYDGRGVASIGSEHRSMTRYETHVLYQHCAFKNLEYGVAVSKNERKQASAEFWYDNVLFQRTRTGVLLNRYNDYDHWFTNCVFIENGVGIDSNCGHFNVYNSHFFRSTVTDVRTVNACHPPSIRWSTSLGSARFYTSSEGRASQPVTLQGNRIEGWTAPDGAIVLGKRGPDLLFDNVFVRPPNAQSPIRLSNRRATDIFTEQLAVLSNNSVEGKTAVLDPGLLSRVTEIPKGAVAADTDTAWYFRTTEDVSGKVFDAQRDFGAKADGRTDDTAALQRTIDAARAHGKGAVAYLPQGRYLISATLNVTGADYALEGTGLRSALTWKGADEGVMVQVVDPRQVRIEHMAMDGPAKGVTRIRQTSAGAPSSVYYNDLHISSVYSTVPGIELVRLPATARVRMGIVSGYVRVIDSGQASILGQIHLGRLVVEGAALPKTGFTGFIYHNTATHDYVVTVKDNQDLVIGDLYNETNERLLLAEGGTRKGDGRITLGLSKASTFEADTVHINDYEGRISLCTGGWQHQGKKDGVSLRQQGERPVSLLLLGNAFNYADPIFEFGPRLRLVRIENNLGISDAAKSFDNELPAQAMDTAAATLDDFRRLGQVNRQMNYAEPVK